MNRLKKKYTNHLVSKMSFLIGMGSAFNLGGSYYIYNTSKNTIKADEKAILEDWQVINQDLLDVFEEEGFDKKKILKKRKQILDA